MSNLTVDTSPSVVWGPRLPSTKVIMESITRQMNALLNANKIVGWSASASYADGSGDHNNAGGWAVIPLWQTVVTPAPGTDNPPGDPYQKPALTSHVERKLRPGVLMTPYLVGATGSVAKTVTAMAAMAAMLRRNPKQQPEPTPLDVPVAKFLPKDWDKTAISGGAFGFPDKMHISHLLEHWSYFPKNVVGVPVADGGLYKNLQTQVESGPVPIYQQNVSGVDDSGGYFNPKTGVLEPPPSPPDVPYDYGKGPGVYSNMAHQLMRILAPYLCEKSPGHYDAMPWHDRDCNTSRAYVDLCQEVFAACGIDDASYTGSPVVRYYNAKSTDASKGEQVDDANSLLTIGASKWRMSVEDLRKLLVGAQQGKPFGHNRDWWKVMTERYWGMGPPHLHPKTMDADTYFTIGLVKMPFFRKGGDETGVSAHAAWQVTADGVTLALEINSSGSSGSGLEQVLQKAYIKAATLVFGL